MIDIVYVGIMLLVIIAILYYTHSLHKKINILTERLDQFVDAKNQKVYSALNKGTVPFDNIHNIVFENFAMATAERGHLVSWFKSLGAKVENRTKNGILFSVPFDINLISAEQIKNKLSGIAGIDVEYTVTPHGEMLFTHAGAHYIRIRVLGE